jgi:hypothetical protein
MPSTTGGVFYRGPSLLDGAPIVGVLTGLGPPSTRSENPKTGDMIQSWILPVGSDPVTAGRNGAQRSVCGDCKHMPEHLNTCYVNRGQAPGQVYRSLLDGCYPDYDERAHRHLLRGRLLRGAAWGDPVAVPLDVWIPLLVACQGHTLYTHQWEEPYCDPLWRRFAMASVDTLAEQTRAHAAGWRTFRVRPVGAPLVRGEVSCPASPEAGLRRTCSTCLACDGQTASGCGASVSIVVHGHGAPTMSSARALARRFALGTV